MLATVTCYWHDAGSKSRKKFRSVLGIMFGHLLVKQPSCYLDIKVVEEHL